MFVKICGITSEEDALLAVALGADAVGFVFAPSPRQIAPVRAGDIARRLPPEVLTVGVFRDETQERVVEAMHKAGLRAAQLHGRETIDTTRYVAEHVPFVFKAFEAGSSELDRASRYPVDAILVDAATPGSGHVFDWALAENAPRDKRLIMAGGLHPNNVRDAIEKVLPWGVDVSTGVEKSPGRKDPRLVRSFITEARAAKVPVEITTNPLPYDWQEDS